jgi:hypothetical protein|tara:strand:+ start:647 stop:784 length:138 start_codon:yes stop_codon:yes gene_type:complete
LIGSHQETNRIPLPVDSVGVYGNTIGVISGKWVNTEDWDFYIKKV